MARHRRLVNLREHWRRRLRVLALWNWLARVLDTWGIGRLGDGRIHAANLPSGDAVSSRFADTYPLACDDTHVDQLALEFRAATTEAVVSGPAKEVVAPSVGLQDAAIMAERDDRFTAV